MAKNTSRELIADLALILVAITWGGSYLAAQELTHVASVPAVLALRFLPAFVLLGGVLALQRGRLTKAVVSVGLVLGTIQAITLALETSAVTHTSASNAGVLTCLAIVIAPALEGLVTGTRLPRPYYLASALSVVGVAMLLGPHGFTSPNIGDLLVLIAAATRAVFVVASGHLTRRGQHFDAVAVCVVQTLLNALVYTRIAAPALGHIVRHLDGGDWAVVAFLSGACTALAFLFQLWAVHHTSAARASLLMGTEPVWALLAGVLIAGDQLGVLGIFGAVVVIGATAWGGRVEAAWRRKQGLNSDIHEIDESYAPVGVPTEPSRMAP